MSLGFADFMYTYWAVSSFVWRMRKDYDL